MLVLRAQLARLRRQRVDLVREQVQVVLARPRQHHAQLRLRVHVARRVRGVRHDQHLHVVALLLRLHARRLQDLLRHLVVVGGDVRLVHHASVTEGHVSAELHEAGGDHDVRVALIEHRRAQRVHGGTRAAENRQLVRRDRRLADLLRHETGQSLAKVLSARAAGGVQIVGGVQLAELGELLLEAVPQVHVISTGNVHHTVRMLRAPRVLGVLGSISHVGREARQVHQTFTTTGQTDGRTRTV